MSSAVHERERRRSCNYAANHSYAMSQAELRSWGLAKSRPALRPPVVGTGAGRAFRAAYRAAPSSLVKALPSGKSAVCGIRRVFVATWLLMAWASATSKTFPRCQRCKANNYSLEKPAVERKHGVLLGIASPPLSKLKDYTTPCSIHLGSHLTVGLLKTKRRMSALGSKRTFKLRH